MSARAAKLSAAAQELLPLHVAVIMDGNGRWAKERGLPRIEGIGAEQNLPARLLRPPRKWGFGI